MYTFMMIVLTLLTVLGSAMLGWLARRYALGGRCGPFGSDELANSLPDDRGLAGGAIGTVAAGTAAVGFADSEASAKPMDGVSSGSRGGTTAKFASSTGIDTLSSDHGAGTDRSSLAGSSASTTASSPSQSATSSASTGSSNAGATTSKAEWFDGDAGGNKSPSAIGNGSTATASAGAVGGVAAAAKLVSGASDDTSSDPKGSGSSTAVTRDTTANGGKADSSDPTATARSAEASTSTASNKTSARTSSDANTAGAASASSSSTSSASTSPDSPTRSTTSGSSDSSRDSGTSSAVQAKSTGSGTSAGTGATARDHSDASADRPKAAPASSATTGQPSNFAKDGSTSHGSSSDSGSSSSSAPLAGAGSVHGKDAAADGDDGGVALVDIPSSLSAEEAEAERLLDSDEEIAAPASRLDAPRSGQSPDDLTKIKGIGPKIDGQLNDRGIYYYDQIANFSGSDLAWADRELGFKGRAVRDRWIPQARGLMDASALDGSDQKAAASADKTASSELAASQAEVRQLRTRLGLNPDSGSGANDPSKSDAQRLEASQQEARELRQQLWSKEQAEKASSQSSTEAGTSSAEGDTAAGLGSFGALSAEEDEAKRMIASGSAPKAASNRLDAPTPGFDPDDLTKIRGIGKPTQSRLNRKGIYYYDQIAGFTAPDLAWADKEMNLEGRVVSDRWIPQAKQLAGETDDDAGGALAKSGGGAAISAAAASGSDDTDDGSEGESLVDVPNALTPEEAEAERLLASGDEIAPPASRLNAPRSGQSPDDLTKIKGIGPKINGKLNDQGIYYYDQIAGFKGSDLAWADRELDFKGRAVRDRWVPQARGLMALSEAEEAVAPAPKTLLDKPIEGRSPDDLTAIKGIGNVLQTQLNEKGIYYYSQIAEFSDSDQKWANETLGFPGRVERDNWIPQARELASSAAAGRTARRGVLSDAGKQLDAMSENAEPGEMSGDETEAMRLIESGTFVADESNRPTSLLQSASNGPADDLQRIKGVGPKLNDLLNSLGIYYFRQVAEFSATDIAWVDSKLQFKGRIVRDRWVDQAKRLT